MKKTLLSLIGIIMSQLMIAQNVALNKPVTFSTEQTANTAAMSTDGNATTRWGASSNAVNEFTQYLNS